MSALRIYDTVVVGGGVSGLATALRRKSRGDTVLLLEKNNRLGGKLDVKEWNGFRWDKGPSLFTLPALVDELFELFGKNSTQYFKYKKHHENTRYVFNDGTRFTLFSEPEKRKAELSKFFSNEEIKRFESYIQDIAKTYNAIGDLFIDRPKMSITNALHPDFVKQYPKILSGKMMCSLNRYNEKELKIQDITEMVLQNKLKNVS